MGLVAPYINPANQAPGIQTGHTPESLAHIDL